MSASPVVHEAPTPVAAPAPRRRLLVVTTHLEMLRGHYQGVLAALAASGYELRIRYVKEKWISADEFTELLHASAPDAAVEALPGRPGDPDELFALRLRQLGNVLRYCHPDYAGRTVLTTRAFEDAPPGVRRWARRIRRLGPRAALAVARRLSRLEQSLPASQAARALVASEQPDAVAIVRGTGEPEFADYLKAAAEQGVASAAWIVSWDNLTNKGLLHALPDRVFVWNERQAEELRRYHGVSDERIAITGAQNFDHWYGGAEPVGRAEFCARFGLPEDRPIVLYLGSSLQIAPDEPEFFARWLAAVRASDDPVLRSASVVVRPHPLVVERWLPHGFDREPGVVLSPSTARDPLNSDAYRQEYRDELRHASVAVGLNTTGQIDAAIFGKPVCTVELPELHDSQRGTIHYELLADGESGLLRKAPTLEEHTAQLAELVRRDPYARDERSDAFVRAFVRPLGDDVRPADVFVRELGAACSASRRPPRRGLAGRIAARFAVVLGAPLEERPFQRVLVWLVAGAIVRWARFRARFGA